MDAVEKANAERQRKWCVASFLASCKFAVFTFYVLFRIKDKKVGEGTYAVVYQGKCFLVYLPYIAYERVSM